MNKQPTSTNQFIFSIYAEDKSGLIGQIMTYFNRSCYHVASINVARTDISDLILVTMEAEVPEQRLIHFTEKLKKIVEVYQVRTIVAGEGLKKTGFYRIGGKTMSPTIWTLMSKYGAVLSSMAEDSLVICKTGSDRDLAELYALLEGPQLLGFCKSGLIVEESLVSFDKLFI